MFSNAWLNDDVSAWALFIVLYTVGVGDAGAVWHSERGVRMQTGATYRTCHSDKNGCMDAPVRIVQDAFIYVCAAQNELLRAKSDSRCTVVHKSGVRSLTHKLCLSCQCSAHCPVP